MLWRVNEHLSRDGEPSFRLRAKASKHRIKTERCSLPPRPHQELAEDQPGQPGVMRLEDRTSSR